MEDRSEPWYVYILRCSDGTLYTGAALDVERRVLEHNTSPKAAKYTRARRPLTLVYAETYASQSEAFSREAAIKKLSRAKKDALIS